MAVWESAVPPSSARSLMLLDVPAALDRAEQVLRGLEQEQGLGGAETRVLGDLDHRLDRDDVGLHSGRRGLHDHGLAQVIVRDGVGHDVDAIVIGHLGPRGCHLTVEQTGIDTGEHELDVAVAEDRALGDGTLMGGRRRDCRGLGLHRLESTLMGGRRRGCRGLGLHRLERLGLDANAGAGLGNDVLGDIVGRLGCV